MSNICQVQDCEKIRDIKKRSKLCSMHRSRWSRHKSYDLITDIIPNGYIMKCQYHGYLKEKQVKHTPYKSKYTDKNLIARTCRECMAESQARSIKNNPERFALANRKSNLKSKFGLSLENYEKLRKEQNNCCAICKKQESAINPKTKKIRELCVDHCHESENIGIMTIRGLLCTKCNFGIGYFDNSIERMYEAIEYLRPYEEA